MIQNKSKAQNFYKEVMESLQHGKFSFLIGGAFSLYHYTRIYRDTKDLDIFCKAEDYPDILKYLSNLGFKIELTDPRWLAKAFKGAFYIDLIFNTTSNISPVDDSWFEHAVKGKLFDVSIQFIGPEELFWTKIYVQNRERYDGADINHLILRYGDKLNWKRVWMRMRQHWHLLMSQLLNFQFVYPSDKDLVPRWLFQELLDLATSQFELPTPAKKICMGPLIDQTQYEIDVVKWKYKSLTNKTV